MSLCISVNCSADFRPLFSDLSPAAWSFLPTVSISRPRARPASAVAVADGRKASDGNTYNVVFGDGKLHGAAGVEIPSDDIEKIWKHCQLIFVMMTW